VRGPVRFALVVAVAALVLPPPSRAQWPGDAPRASVAPAFSGRYKLVLTFGRGCPAAVQVGNLTVLTDLAEASVSAGSEVSGQSASPSEKPEDARFVLLRQGDKLHGAFGMKDAPYIGFRTLEGFRVWMRIMADGAATTSSGRAQGSGTAYGEIDLSRPGDADLDTIGYCDALDHTWSLEPA
jgi:hypothetical protein